MIVHLGRRVSALLDGQLSRSEAERAWQHVHLCPPCRDLVEREGRIKTELAGLGRERDVAPSYLKGSLLGDISAMAPAYPDVEKVSASRSQHRVTVGLLGTGALGFAMLGAVAFTGSLGPAPSIDRRLPVSDLSVTSSPRPQRAPVQNAVVETVTRSVTSATASVQRVRSGQHLERIATRPAK